jgi:hypothetical protein
MIARWFDPILNWGFYSTYADSFIDTWPATWSCILFSNYDPTPEICFTVIQISLIYCCGCLVFFNFLIQQTPH